MHNISNYNEIIKRIRKKEFREKEGSSKIKKSYLLPALALAGAFALALPFPAGSSSFPPASVIAGVHLSLFALSKILPH